MLNIHLIVIGKLKEKYLTNGCEEYIKRLSSYCKLTIYQLDEYKIADNPSEAQIDQCLQEEGKKIIAKIPKSAVVIPMCIEGKQLSSTELADKFVSYSNNGKSHIAFIIGGSHGLSPEVKNLADYKLSMSKMTFPHQLARLMLLEQIYRGLSIIGGSKYHK